MAGNTLKVICKDRNGIKAAINAVTAILNKAIDAGAVYIEIGRDSDRTKAQNKKMWPMLTDIVRHIPKWYGYTMTEEDYKDMISAGWRSQALIPNEDNTGFIALGVRTSKLKKWEFCELIECLHFFASKHHVPLSDPALKVYEDCMEYLRSQVVR